jgi:predicted Zn-dependent protease
MKSLFESIGYQLGKTAAKAKNIFDLAGGEGEESVRAEIRLGYDLAAALLERIPLVVDNAETKFTRDVGRWLGGHVKERRMPFFFRVTAERAPNAFALVGGHVFVSWPLLQMCQGQRDEIAFILAHEMAHIVMRHAVDRIVRDALFSLLLRQSAVKQAASAWLGRVGQQALSRAYSRENELEADAYAVSLIAASGGDALAGEQVLEKLIQRKPDSGTAGLGEYWATHPPLAERLAHMRSQRLAGDRGQATMQT